MIVSTEHNILQIVRDEAGGAEGDQPEDPQEPSPSEPENEHPEKKMKVDESEKPNRKGDDKDDVSEATQISLEKGDDHKNENYTDAKDGISFDLRKYYLLMKETDNTAKSNSDDAANEEVVQSAGDETAVDKSAGPTDTMANDKHLVTSEASATSNDSNTNKNAEDNKDDKECDGEEREKKDEIKKGGARNLWISGLAEGTRAKDLKQFCRKHGKVIEAKVVTDAKTPGSHCYGFVVMASTEDAENCIKHLDKTEFNGRMITIVKAKTESESSREQTARPNRRSSKDRKKDGTVSQDKAGRSPSSCDCRRLPRDVRSLSTIRKERDAMRARERLRREKLLLRERERQQRHEKHRLEIERDKLRAEREQLEREKREILRIERERETLERDRLKLEQQRLEQEKLELERLELKQTQLSQKQPQFAAPPPPRVEISAGYNGGSAKPDRDNPRQVSSGNPKCLSNGNVNVYARQPMPPSTRPKGPSRPYNTQDKRSYNWRDNRSYRPPAPYKPVNSYAPTWYPVTAPPATGYVSGIGQAWPNQPYYGSSKSGGGAYEAYYQPVSAFTGMSGWGYNY